MTSNVLAKFLDWLHAGYPDGVPETDYIPLLEILRRRLTSAEVEEVAERLSNDPSLHVTGDHIRSMISEVALTPADDADVRRVAAHLAAGGWPLADVDA